MSIFSVYTTTKDLNLDDLNYEYQIIVVDASLNDVKVFFPKFRTQGLWIKLIRVDNSANTVTLLSSPLDGMLINHFPSQVFPINSGKTFVSLSSGWFLS